ncbi:unnamed protein product, partial [Closterium sp. NIES-54]
MRSGASRGVAERGSSSNHPIAEVFRNLPHHGSRANDFRATAAAAAFPGRRWEGGEGGEELCYCRVRGGATAAVMPRGGASHKDVLPKSILTAWLTMAV